jgi:hypothetical protein
VRTPLIRLRTLGATIALVLACPACLSPHVPPMPRLATAEVSNDFETYEIRRVGLLPFQGRTLTADQREQLQTTLFTEVAQSTPWEVVLLEESDLQMIEASSPHRRGWYRPRTVIQLAERYTLDAILVGTVLDERFFPPQRLSMSVDLVSSETGLLIWTSSIHLDAGDPRVEDGLRAFYAGDENPEAWRLALLSPERFARFAAYQVACLL